MDTHRPLVLGAGGAPAQLPAGDSLAGDIAQLVFELHGGGEAIAPGLAVDLPLGFAGTILSWVLTADQTGSIEIDLWRDSFANYPPTDADSITASAPPALSSAAAAQDATLSGWSTSFAAGDVIRAVAASSETIERATLSLLVRKS